MKLKLSEARVVFDELRKDKKIIVRRHAHKDYPDRQFTENEIKYLVAGQGHLIDNNFPSAIEDSFLFVCKDLKERRVELAVLLEDNVIVVSAFRRVQS